MGGAYLNDDVFFLQFDAIKNFSSWDVGPGKESGGDALILTHPNAVLKVKITQLSFKIQPILSRLWTW